MALLHEFSPVHAGGQGCPLGVLTRTGDCHLGLHCGCILVDVVTLLQMLMTQ